jgi:hypothetical protein
MCYDVVRINYYCYTKTVDDNAWVHLWFMLRSMLLFFLAFYVVFFACLRPLSCVPSIVGFSILSISSNT